jgi:hypothetical protein
MANFALSPTSLRSLKNALLDRFPSVKSAHLSEAIAVSAGFRTHASLIAYFASTQAIPLVDLEARPFVHRLHELGYPGIQIFSFADVWVGATAVPEELRNLLARVLTLEEQPDGHYNAIYALRRECASLFAKAFGIGYVEPIEDDKRRVKRLNRGIDHKSCKAGWGNVVNTNRPGIDFPGTDHQVRFCERLPVSNGKYVEYSSALVSMPYKGSTRIPELPAAQAMAESVGWQYAELDGWSWYQGQGTTLILFRRTTTHEEMLQMWSNSFKRWLIENKSRLLKGASQDRRYVINDAIDCQHLPLDVQSWDDLEERYFKEFVPSMYRFEEDPMVRAFKKVFDKWLSERGSLTLE